MDAENAEERKLRACPYSIASCLPILHPRLFLALARMRDLLQHELEHRPNEWCRECKLYVELRVESGNEGWGRAREVGDGWEIN